MTRDLTIRAMLGALACLACGVAAAQDQARHHGREEGRGAPGGYQRAEPYGAGPGFQRREPERREPGSGPYPGPAPIYAPPLYPSPPPRRIPPPPPGWRAAREDVPGPGEARMASLGWVIGALQRRAPGRELDADLGYIEGRPIYRILWMTVRGRRLEVIVDAQTGAILSER